MIVRGNRTTGQGGGILNAGTLMLTTSAILNNASIAPTAARQKAAACTTAAY